MRTEKLGFWSLTSLVAGSQIGTGIFLLPATLVLYGVWGIGSWFIAGGGALLLAFVFGSLAADRPKTGGPHTFIEAAFGPTFGFFSAWLYWIISWFSSSLVVVSIITYLTPLIGDLHPLVGLLAKLGVLALVTWLNILGVRSAGRTEFILTLLKLIPLVLVPLCGLWCFNFDHLRSLISGSVGGFQAMSEATLLTFWGFIGVESATTPAESVMNPKKTIPRALITGTLLVAFVYTFSSTVVMGVIPFEQLAQSKAPFAAAAQSIFGTDRSWGGSRWPFATRIHGDKQTRGISLGSNCLFIRYHSRIDSLNEPKSSLYHSFYYRCFCNSFSVDLHPFGS
jgi:APA family basic amino acid/polyamine antiporter